MKRVILAFMLALGAYAQYTPKHVIDQGLKELGLISSEGFPSIDEVKEYVVSMTAMTQIKTGQLNLVPKIVEVFPIEEMGEKKFYITIQWGYNRAKFAPANTIIENPHGVVKIWGAQGRDRPTEFTFEKYFGKNFTIPQYYYRLGINFKTKNGVWGIEAGMDHMKWVFDYNRNYKITGHYDRPLWAYTENGLRQLDFEEIAESGNATPFSFEYTDGHNYVNAAVFYQWNIINKKNFQLQAGPDVGFGLYVPKPHARILDSDGWHKGENGRFQISGFGGHVGGKSRFMFFNRVFIEGQFRVVGIRSKVNIYNAGGEDFEKGEFTITQPLNLGFEYYAGFGVVVAKF